MANPPDYISDDFSWDRQLLQAVDQSGTAGVDGLGACVWKKKKERERNGGVMRLVSDWGADGQEGQGLRDRLKNGSGQKARRLAE